MSDRKLLEYAAKAAGYVIDDYVGDNSDVAWVYPVDSLKNDDGEFPEFKWLPLTNDGDALRLAVKLKVWIEQWPDEDGLGPYCSTSDGIIEHHENDALAATRRAIVRAAAKIGKSMENK